MDVSPQMPKSFVDETAAETCKKETTWVKGDLHKE